MKHPASLKSNLIRRLVPLQAALLAILMVLLVGTLWFTGLLLHQRDEEHIIDVLRQAISRDGSGGIVLTATSELQALRSETPNLWFLIRDRSGHSLAEGNVPTEFATIGESLDNIGHAKLGWDRSEDSPRRIAAQMKRIDTAAGNVQIIATTEGKISEVKSALYTGLLFLGLVLPSLLLMTLATVVATPRVVRHALIGLRDTARHARDIDIDKRGTRLPVSNVSMEIVPLVSAVNDALSRLDEGYDRHRRFLAGAAHELRTPIAILGTRLETLPPGTVKARLLEDIARLANLAEQLLDLQRLEQRLAVLSHVELVGIGAQVTADLAPMAVSAGYDISFTSEVDRIETWGDKSSLERALVNLVQNAIQHGGNSGAIAVAVKLPATIEVCDQGRGIPAAQREEIFEPFRRLQPHNRGAGLGLHLVREVVRMHFGKVSVVDGNGSGTCFRITLMPLERSVPNLTDQAALVRG